MRQGWGAFCDCSAEHHLLLTSGPQLHPRSHTRRTLSSRVTPLAPLPPDPPALRAALPSYREGALPLRRAGPTTEAAPDAAAGAAAAPLLWSTSPAPLRAGSKGVLLYNSRAGPLAWLDPAQGHPAPRLSFGFNNWALGAEPVDMAPSTAMPVGAVGEGRGGGVLGLPAVSQHCVPSRKCGRRLHPDDHSPFAKENPSPHPVRAAGPPTPRRPTASCGGRPRWRSPRPRA